MIGTYPLAYGNGAQHILTFSPAAGVKSMNGCVRGSVMLRLSPSACVLETRTLRGEGTSGSKQMYWKVVVCFESAMGFKASGSDMEKGKQRSGGGAYEVLLFPEEYGPGSDPHPFVGLYDRPLPCCGCGIGWFSFLVGFIFPLLWYYGTIRFFWTQRQNDPRERPGLAACAIAALVSTVALVITLIILLVLHQI